MLDIRRVFLTTELNRCTCFVASSLTNIAPITTSEFGLGKILTELKYLKSKMKKIEDSCERHTLLLETHDTGNRLGLGATCQTENPTSETQRVQTSYQNPLNRSDTMQIPCHESDNSRMTLSLLTECQAVVLGARRTISTVIVLLMISHCS